MSDEDMIRRGDALIPHSLITIWYDAAHEFLQECDDWLKLKRQNHPSAAGLNFTVTAQRREIARLLFLDLAWLSGGSELEQAPDRIATLPAVTPATSPGVTAGAVGELLPCPFCGGKARRITIGDDEPNNAGGDVICCDACEASSAVEFGRKENLVSKWNRRTTPPTALDDPKVRKLVARAADDGREVYSDHAIAREAADYMEQLLYAALRDTEGA